MTDEISQDNQLVGTTKVAPAMGGSLKETGERSKKTPVQLTWENISITAQPPKGRCKPKNALTEPKEIIRGVSGTVMPGQFLAIIGASGK
jgi:ABC-type multidrug transport system fused ATPase/permease subunit